jgi:hypothetical protein
LHETNRQQLPAVMMMVVMMDSHRKSRRSSASQHNNRNQHKYELLHDIVSRTGNLLPKLVPEITR